MTRAHTTAARHGSVASWPGGWCLGGLVLITATGLGACSLGVFDRTECERDEDCAVLGPSLVCGSEGYCDPRPACSSDEQCRTDSGDASFVCASSGACEQKTCSVDGDCAGLPGAFQCSASLCAPIPPCTSHAECRARNGWGSACEEGACVGLTPHPRCTATFPDNLYTWSERADAVVFGSIMNHMTAAHVRRERSAELAVFQANAEDALGERDFGMIFCTIEQNSALDELSSSDAAKAVGTWLSDVAGVPGIMGPAGSGDAQAVFDLVRAHQTVMISPSATSPALTTVDNTAPTDEMPGLFWRTAPPDSLQGQTMAEDLSARGVSKVIIIYQPGAYGEGLSAVFQRSFPSSAVARVEPFDTPAALPEIVTQLEADPDNPEVIFISSVQEDVTAFLSAASSPGWDNQIFLTDAAASTNVVGNVAPALAPLIRGTRPAPITGTPVYNAFVGAFRARYMGEDVTAYSFTAHAYDATWMLMYGAAWSYAQQPEHAVTGLGIAKGLRKLSAPLGSGELPIDVTLSSWRTIRAAFGRGEAVNINGASGALDFDPMTEETSAPISVWRVSPICAATSGGPVFEIEDLSGPGATPPERTCP